MVTVFKWYNFHVWSSENEFIALKQGIISYIYEEITCSFLSVNSVKSMHKMQNVQHFHSCMGHKNQCQRMKLTLKIELIFSLNYQNVLNTCNRVLYPRIFLVNSRNEVVNWEIRRDPGRLGRELGCLRCTRVVEGSSGSREGSCGGHSLLSRSLFTAFPVSVGLPTRANLYT